MTPGKIMVDIPNHHLKMEPLLNGKPAVEDSFRKETDNRPRKKRPAAKCNIVNLRTFVLVSGTVMCAQFALSIYTKSVLTSIERIFVISSSLAGIVVGAFNFGNMLFVVLVSKLSTNGHRPHIMAAGSLLIALGGFTNVIPHFASLNYNATSLHSFQASYNDTEREMVDVEALFDCSSSNSYIILILGEILQGIGATVLVPLASSYIDDYANKGCSPLYIGIMFFLQNLGPGIGYLFGSLTTMLYVDFERVEQDQIQVQMSDKSWVGAWWLGYIIIGAWVVVSAIPLLWFPKEMHEKFEEADLHNEKRDLYNQNDSTTALPSTNGIHRENHVDQLIPSKEDEFTKSQTYTIDAKTIAIVHIPIPSKPGIIKDLLLTLKRLITDPLYMLVVMGYTGLMFVVGALTAFMPKFLEVVFYQTKTQASLIFGLSMPIVICFGLLTGGFVVKRFRWDITSTMRFIVCTSTLGIFLCIPPLFVKCDPEESIICANASGETSDCIDTQGSACKHQCYLFAILISLAAFVCCQMITPAYSIILRAVSKEDKCTAIGFKFLIIRMAAFIPAPVITGAIIDDTCMVWSKSEDCIDRTTCLNHDRESFRKSYLCIIIIGVVCTCLFNFAGYAVQRRKKPSLDKGNQSDTTIL